MGTQEADNQQLAAEEASKILGLEREGELISRQAQFGKVQSLMGLASVDLRNANQARANAQDQISSGMDAMASGAMNFGAAGGVSGLGGVGGGGTDYSSWQNKATDGGGTLFNAYKEYAGGLQPGAATGVLTFEEWKELNKQNFS